MIRAAAFLALSFIATAASGAELGRHWTPLTVTEESAYQVANILDWGTTNNIPRSAGWYCPKHSSCTWKAHCYWEDGDVWALGRFPSQARINQYMAASAGIHLLVSYALLNHPYAEQVWQLVTLGLKANAVGNNFSIGMRVRF